MDLVAQVLQKMLEYEFRTNSSQQGSRANIYDIVASQLFVVRSCPKGGHEDEGGHEATM